MPKRKPRIIILDTDESLALAYKQRLALDGYDCSLYTKPTNLLTHMTSLGVDLLIFDDANIDGMTAVDLIDLIRSQSGATYLPIIVLSSNANYQAIDGVDYHIPKTAADAAVVVQKIKSLV